MCVEKLTDFSAVLGMEPMASHMLGELSTTEPHTEVLKPSKDVLCSDADDSHIPERSSV